MSIADRYYSRQMGMARSWADPKSPALNPGPLQLTCANKSLKLVFLDAGLVWMTILWCAGVLVYWLKAAQWWRLGVALTAVARGGK